MVVPLAGDVDRNDVNKAIMRCLVKSSPSRGTWIEISSDSPSYPEYCVVPLAGDVDRNWQVMEA